MTTPTTNFAWSVNQLETSTSPVDGMADVVKTVHYRVAAVSSDGIEVGAYGTVGLSDPEDPNAFVSYKELTESTVLSWVRSALAQEGETGLEVKQRVEAALQEQISLKRNPPVKASPLPWGQ